MKNVMNKKELQKFIQKNLKSGISKDLSERIFTSRLLGSNFNLILHGGGNTSVKSKTKDETGEMHDVIYIKGSGSDLRTIDQSGFPAVKLEPLKKIMNKKFITDETMVKYIRKNLIDPSSPNPSVETLVHAIINEKFVDHTHANSILEITNRPDGITLINKLFGKHFIIIPYVMPGYLLAKKVFQMYKRNKNLHGLILFRHGIFTFADQAEISYKRMTSAVSKAEKFLRKEKVKKIPRINMNNLNISASEVAPILRKHCSINRDYVINFRKNKILLNNINCKNIESYLSEGVITPDHVIRTKPKPLIMNLNHFKNINSMEKYISHKFLLFKKDYVKYFNTNKPRKKLKMLDTVPQIILVQNLGMFSLGRTFKESVINGDVAEMSINTIIRIQERSKFKSIAKKDIFNVEYWSLEQAKLKKEAKQFEGKVVIITGGAGTIGYATAKKFRENGAEVIILDKDRQKIREIQRNTEFFCYVCDVANRAFYKKILSKICLTHGGVDIVVSNAGSAVQSTMIEITDKELKKSFDINFFSHQIVASESTKIMIKQNKGGCLLFNISKQSINPGKNFGSYGTSKAALLSLCKQYALEYGQYGIRSNGINADRIQSGLLNKKMLKERAKSRNVSVKTYLSGNLLNREVYAKDVADAFFHLATSYKTTAAVYTVDGGNIEASMR